MSKLMPIVQLKNVFFRYRNNLPYCLIDISLTVNKGEYVVIIGQNGSGKTTLSKLISGLLTRFSGSIKLFGEKIDSISHSEIIRRIGVVFQNPENQFIGATVQKDLVFTMENFGYSPNLMRRKLYQKVKKMNFESILFSAPEELSDGTKQKVAFGSTTIVQPDLIIMDEPTSMLSPANKLEIEKIIEELRIDSEITLIEVTHEIERIFAADKIIIIDYHKIIFSGSPTDLKKIKLAPLTKIFGDKLPMFYQLVLTLLKNKIISTPIWNEKKLIETLIEWKKSK